MRAALPFLVLAALLTLLRPWALGQEPRQGIPRELDWDLSYTALLKTNEVGPDRFLAKWLKGTDRSFTRRFLASWGDGPISASVLIEHPAFHAGEHAVVWLVRTKEKAFCWRAWAKCGKAAEKQEISTKRFDDAFKALSSWKQAKPSGVVDQERHGLGGFIGFLSVWDGQHSRQMLLTTGDFFGPAKGSERGRLAKTLERIVEF